jgi:Leucine-rich repeat (LRR) protein
MLSAHDCGLYGTIPDEISLLTNLVHLSLGFNNLTGTVPSLANTNLLQLDLSKNGFTGSVPRLNEHLKFNITEESYVSIDLARNSFSGEFDLPQVYVDNIDLLAVADNKFTSVSSKFENNTKTFVVCSASGNPFKCPIPEWFTQTCHLTACK